MEELATSMTKHTVIIPTAGLGSRMGSYTTNLNKALLPYLDEPVIAHIIKSFPKDTNFIIPVGYLKQQVMDFCTLAFADRNITFVEIDDYTSTASGTAYTLKQCQHLIANSFWYVPCDTYFAESVVDKIGIDDCYFVKQVAESDSHLYTMFNVSPDFKITDITFKQTVREDWLAYTGLAFINDYRGFLDRLNRLESNEFIFIIEPGSDVAELNTWQDFGNPEEYQTALTKSQKFDFTKKDELTYITNNRVVKWWLDPTVAQKKYKKFATNMQVFPPNCRHSGNYIAYDYWPGATLYQYNNPDRFDDFLAWLETSVWQDYAINIEQASLEFYKDKTLNRIKKFVDKYPHLPAIKTVNGMAVKDYTEYLDAIDWQYLSTVNRPGFMHGDLQFDNVIIDENGSFKLIDWRHEFAGLVEYGDIYYDLAKMSGGFIINYANIKGHNFDVEVDDNLNAVLSIPNIDNITIYQRKLKKYILDNNLDYKKVQTLIPIIFWNMAPLHTAPFDIFLWYLGLKLFAELEQ